MCGIQIRTVDNQVFIDGKKVFEAPRIIDDISISSEQPINELTGELHEIHMYAPVNTVVSIAGVVESVNIGRVRAHESCTILATNIKQLTTNSKEVYHESTS